LSVLIFDPVGHKEPTTVTSYNPQLFRNNSSDKPYAVLAVASQDGAISIWATCAERPLAVLVGQFDRAAVTDISWTRNGMKLLAASTDGTLMYAEFDTDELGTPLDEDERSAVISVQKKGLGKGGAALPEDPTLMSLQAKGKQLLQGAAGVAVVGSPTKKLQAPAKLPSKSILELQTEVILPNGRRRIKPVFLGESGSHVPVAAAAAAAAVAVAATAPLVSPAALGSRNVEESSKFVPPLPPASKRRKQSNNNNNGSSSNNNNSSQPAITTLVSSSDQLEEDSQSAFNSAAPAKGKGARNSGKKKRSAYSSNEIAPLFEESDRRELRVELSADAVARSSEWLSKGVSGPRILQIEVDLLKEKKKVRC
jgi:hypothetical protein